VGTFADLVRAAFQYGAPQSEQQAILTPLISVFGGASGAVPASPGGTTQFLRADGTWAVPVSGGGVGSAIINVLTADCIYTSSTTLANAGNTSGNMPIVTVPGPGTYLIDALLMVYEPTAGTGGAKWNMNAGSAPVSAFAVNGNGLINGTFTDISSIVLAMTTWDFAGVTTGIGNPNPWRVQGFVTFSGPGTFGFLAAQHGVSANPTHFTAGSYLQLTQAI